MNKCKIGWMTCWFFLGCTNPSNSVNSEEISDAIESNPVETDSVESSHESPFLVLADESGAPIGISLSVAEESPLLSAAKDDLAEVIARSLGMPLTSTPGAVRIRGEVRPEQEPSLGLEGFSIQKVSEDGSIVLEVSGASLDGLAYGLYQITHWLGAVYLHPEETVYPRAETLELPWDGDAFTSTPRFAMRGFHEHTQHPTVMSDYLLKPGEEGFRETLSRYLRWLARNRQNQLTFHMLKTVNVEAWAPYMKDVVEEAHGLNIEVGAFIGFVDQQQNAYKMLGEIPELSEEEQIALRVDAVLSAGLDVLGVQIGASEFVKPPDEDVLRWTDLLLTHLEENWPEVSAYAWIHVPCDLESEDGGYFFHLPLQSDDRFGAFVHTTMHYDLENPAPVYGCQDFSHQKDFIAASSDDRSLVFFPETAWWLGFDNNLPMFLPLTGWSRGHDVLTQLKDTPKVTGHVTFTTGREWGYWMFDHYLTRVTWDGETTWDAYLESIAPVFGAEGGERVRIVQEWTTLQRLHFYETHPLIFFYLTGELPADELGAKVDAGARPVKPSYQEVFDLDEAEFTTWFEMDYGLLQEMESSYGALLTQMPLGLGEEGEEAHRIQELERTMAITVKRIQHALALYRAVIFAREGKESEAWELHGEASVLSEEVRSWVEIHEGGYRYPLELLAREKESLTSYQYGYLYETSTVYFWTRRDDQLALFLSEAFSVLNESWEVEPTHVFQSGVEEITLTAPSDAVASAVIEAFMPTFLFGFVLDGETLSLRFAEDTNGNGLPDEGTEQGMTGTRTDLTWVGGADVLSVRLIDSAGVLIQNLLLLSPVLTLTLASWGPFSVEFGLLDAQVGAQDMIDTIASFEGIDEAGATGLIGSIYGYEPGEDFPEYLPFSFEFTFVPVAPAP